MRTDDGENRGRHELGGSENGQRRNTRENPARKTSPEVASRNRDRALYERSRLSMEGAAQGRRPRASAQKDETREKAERRISRASREAERRMREKHNREALDDGLFDDLSIDEDILSDTNMEDKIFSQAMNSDRGERRRPKELNTAGNIIDRDEYSSEK